MLWLPCSSQGLLPTAPHAGAGCPHSSAAAAAAGKGLHLAQEGGCPRSHPSVNPALPAFLPPCCSTEVVAQEMGSWLRHLQLHPRHRLVEIHCPWWLELVLHLKQCLALYTAPTSAQSAREQQLLNCWTSAGTCARLAFSGTATGSYCHSVCTDRRFLVTSSSLKHWLCFSVALLRHEQHVSPCCLLLRGESPRAALPLCCGNTFS